LAMSLVTPESIRRLQRELFRKAICESFWRPPAPTYTSVLSADTRSPFAPRKRTIWRSGRSISGAKYGLGVMKEVQDHKTVEFIYRGQLTGEKREWRGRLPRQPPSPLK